MPQTEKLSLSEPPSPKVWKRPEKQSSTRTRFCKYCFQPIGNNSFTYLLREDICLCNKCYSSFEPIYESFELNGVSGTTIYKYNEAFKSLLFQYKACFDIELAPLFLERPKYVLRMKFANYVLIPAPSTKEADEKRGFNHVVEAFKILKRPIFRLIEKTEDVKQASQGKHRGDIKKYFSIKNGETIKGKNVLLVDDVRTSGSTLKAMIDLVRKYQPRRIKILVLSQTSHDALKRKTY